MSVKLITDSASDMGTMQNDIITCIPLKVRFGLDEYLDGVNLTHEEFYDKLENSGEFPQTSQAGPYEWTEAIEKELANGADEIIIITLSSKVSGTFQSASLAAAEYDNVYVVDSKQVTIGEMLLVRLAEKLIREGKGAKEIVEILEKEKERILLIAMVDTLEYLAKGGRISGLAAAAGSMLNLKPIIGVDDGIVVTYGKARGVKKGQASMNVQIARAGGIDFDMPYYVGFTGDRSKAEDYLKNHHEFLKADEHDLGPYSVGGTIGTHAGPGAVTIAFFRGDEQY
ncbi:MAG: DegV family protein [Erysipelotrichaceae bacterium]|nr:DegV family protein [Erysipelotrichaceae bacterium]